MPFFVLMTVFWGIVLFVVTSLLERRLNWRFYADPRIHAPGLLVFSLALSLLGGCYWGFYMWKFYESKRKHAETKLKSPNRTSSSQCLTWTVSALIKR